MAGPLAAQEHEGKIIDRIQASSNVNVPLSKIRGVMSLKEGEPFSSARLKADFRAIWNLGYFRDLRIDLTPVSEDRVSLNVVVEERYRIRVIRFAGVVKYAEQTLLDELTLKVEDYYSPAVVNKAVNQIKDKYRSSGYLMTRVKPEVKTLEKKKEVELLFEVTEGAEMVVGQIRFFGNSNLNADALSKDMELHEDKWYREGKYDDLLLEKDKEKILYAYKKAGYVNARLLETKVGTRWRDPAKKDVREVLLDFTVSEGDKYFFGDISLRGARIFTEEELRRTLRRKAGEVFNQEIHDGDLATLAKLYQERGFIFSRVTPVESVDPKTKKISYVFDIYEGEKAHVERIFIVGNDKTKEFVIRRELEIQEGEVFNTTKIRRSFERVMNLQFFKNVQPDYRPGSAEGLMNLIFNVEEQRTGMISAGLGLGTATGLSFNAEIRENNFRGLGQTLGFKLTFGERQKIFSINFTEPWVLPKGPQITLGASFSASLNVQGIAIPGFTNGFTNVAEVGSNVYTNTIPNTSGTLYFLDVNGNLRTNYILDLAGQLPYTSGVFSLSAFASTRLGYWYVVGMNHALEFRRDYFETLFPADPTLPSQKELTRQSLVRQQFGTATNLLNDGAWRTTYTISWSLNRDSRDNNLNPTRGTLVKGTMDWVFIQNNMTRWNLQFSAYQKFLKYFVFAWQSDLWTLGNPIFGDYHVELDQYYTFTREEMRGWEYPDVYSFRSELQGNARNKAEGRNYITAGYYNYGQAKVRHGMEIRFPIAEQVLWGLWFFDMGTLSANRVGLDAPRGYDFIVPFSRPLDRWLQEYMFDTGVGLRLQIPAFPIRLYLSWKFNYNAENNTWDFYRQNKTRIFYQENAKDTTGIPFVEPTFVLNIFGFF